MVVVVVQGATKKLACKLRGATDLRTRDDRDTRDHQQSRASSNSGDHVLHHNSPPLLLTLAC